MDLKSAIDRKFVRIDMDIDAVANDIERMIDDGIPDPDEFNRKVDLLERMALRAALPNEKHHVHALARGIRTYLKSVCEKK